MSVKRIEGGSVESSSFSLHLCLVTWRLRSRLEIGGVHFSAPSLRSRRLSGECILALFTAEEAEVTQRRGSNRSLLKLRCLTITDGKTKLELDKLANEFFREALSFEWSFCAPKAREGAKRMQALNDYAT